MERDALRKELEEFAEDLTGLIIIGVKSDNTVNVKTNVYDKDEYQSVLTTALLMAVLQPEKFGSGSGSGFDSMH
jgi:hypothetical protein